MGNWEKYLEGNYDENGNLIARYKQRKDDEQQAREVAEQVEKMYNYYIKRADIKKYLVDGAELRCNQATLEPFKMSDGTEIKLDFDKETEAGSEDSDKKLIMDKRHTKLHVTNTQATDNELPHATILDCEQGKGKNIEAFECNCKLMDDREEEYQNIKDDPECSKTGVCKYLMKLSDQWENLPINGKYETVEVQNPKNGTGKVTVEWISMTSMLFCKHGGLITPVDSGQVEEKRNKDVRILKLYLSTGDINEQMAEEALIELAKLAEKELPQYTSERGYDYNRYDQYIIGWTEYYKYEYDVEIDPVYIKSQIYEESRMGYGYERTVITNVSRDIMQALDVRNYNIYEYIDISLDDFKAITNTGDYKMGRWIWDQNIGGDGPGESDSEKRERCGIVKKLFNTELDGTGKSYYEDSSEQYYLILENVTPVMSIGVGLDKMQELLDRYDGDYETALQKYNVGNPDYVEDIIARVNQNGIIQGE